jgi:hypothetical protein
MTLKTALSRHFFASILIAVALFFATVYASMFSSFALFLWMSFGFLFSLFCLLYVLVFKALETKIQSVFMQYFALIFGVKIFATLVWLLYLIFGNEVRQVEFVGLFFFMYLSYTFLWMWAVWHKSKEK